MLSPYLVWVAPEDEIAAEVTAMEMGWVPVKNDDGITIWVRSRASVTMRRYLTASQRLK